VVGHVDAPPVEGGELVGGGITQHIATVLVRSYSAQGPWDLAFVHC
jgi:hypothetical protein